MDNLDFSALSEREQGILTLAIDGLTDQQIGNRLDISASTVNSYWVRIRGKLGHLSRTELVSRILQQRAIDENGLLKRRIEELERDLDTTREAVWNNENANQLRLALETLPEPVLIFDEFSTVRFANVHAETLFRRSAEELRGTDIKQIIKSEDWKPFGVAGPQNFESGKVQKYGVDSVLYAVRSDRMLVRVVAVVGFTKENVGPLCVCILRSFTEELDALRRRAAIVARQAIAAH